MDRFNREESCFADGNPSIARSNLSVSHQKQLLMRLLILTTRSTSVATPRSTDIQLRHDLTYRSLETPNIGDSRLGNQRWTDEGCLAHNGIVELKSIVAAPFRSPSLFDCYQQRNSLQP